jgi:hypothetical protein
MHEEVERIARQLLEDSLGKTPLLPFVAPADQPPALPLDRAA